MNSKSVPHFFLPFLLVHSISAFSTTWVVQVGAFKSLANAENAFHSLNQRTDLPSELMAGKNGLYFVHAGPFIDKKAAEQALSQVNEAAFSAFLKEGSSSSNIVKKRNQPTLPTVETVNKKVVLTGPAGDFSPATESSFYGFPYQARGLIDGTWGQITNLGNGDFMFPLIGNDNWIAYFDGAAKYGDDRAWFGSFGGGFRGVFSENIWGAYFFADNNESSQHSVFWFANPGLEFMTPSWDLHFNGYIPLSSKTASLGNFLASELGIPGTQIIGRTFYDPVYSVEEIVGPGIDGEVGYTFENYYQVRPFIGGYHFFSLPNGSNINGIEGGIQIPFGNNIQVLIHDAYDRVQKNTAMGTLRIVMGSVPKTRERNVRERMLDPIERHLGAYQTGAGVPILSNDRYIRTVTLSNIWFFSPIGSAFVGSNSCTPENPCLFNQTAIDGINTLSPNANLFMAPGTYNNPAVGSGFSIQNGQSMYGRNLTWLRPAYGDERGLVNDSLRLYGNNLITSLRVNGLSTLGSVRTALAVFSDVVDPITVQNSTLSLSYSGASSFAVINSTGTNQFHLLNSDLILNSSSTTAQGYGIFNIGAPLLIQHSSITMNSNDDNVLTGLNSAGNVIFANSSMNISATGGHANDWHGFNTTGGLAIEESSINLNIGLNGTTTGSVGGINAQGELYLGRSSISVAVSNGSAFVAGVNTASPAAAIRSSSILVSAQNVGSTANVFAVNTHSDPFNLSNSSLASQSNVGNAIGLGTNSGSVTRYENSVISATAIVGGTASATSVLVNSSATIINGGNMTCIQIQNGVTTTIPCP